MATVLDGGDRPAWPARLIDLGDDPADVAPGWAEHVQGTSVGAGCWFLTQVDRIWRVPIDADPAVVGRDDPHADHVPIPVPGIDHLGDCDVHAERLYVAMEGTAPAQIGWFDLDLSFVAAARLPGGVTSCPWCALNPIDGLLYTSPFDTDRLHVHQPVHRDGAFELRPVREVTLSTEDGTPCSSSGSRAARSPRPASCTCRPIVSTAASTGSTCAPAAGWSTNPCLTSPRPPTTRSSRASRSATCATGPSPGCAGRSTSWCSDATRTTPTASGSATTTSVSIPTAQP